MLRLIACAQNGQLLGLCEFVGLFDRRCLRALIFVNLAISASPAFQCALAEVDYLCHLVSGSTTDNGFIKQLQQPCTFVQRRQSSSLLSGSSPYKASSFFDNTSSEVVSARALSLRRTSAFSFLMVSRDSRFCF